MQSIVLYHHTRQGEETFEYNFYDHKFAPTNLVVRKILMAMMDSVRQRLTHLEVEYNDKMLADKLGKKAVETLTLLGADSTNLIEHKSNGIVYSRSFTAQMTAERFQYFYLLQDVGTFFRFRLLEEEQERVVFHFNQYLLLQIPTADTEGFYQQLRSRSVPYKVQAIT